jgi:hypothetical protein
MHSSGGRRELMAVVPSGVFGYGMFMVLLAASRI